jgi:hypothetical protein
MYRLIVDPLRGRWTSCRKIVDTNLRQDIVVRPWILIRPIVQLLVDPCKQPDRRAGYRVAYRLRLGPLELEVGGTLFLEPFSSRNASFFFICERTGFRFWRRGLGTRRALAR